MVFGERLTARRCWRQSVIRAASSSSGGGCERVLLARGAGTGVRVFTGASTASSGPAGLASGGVHLLSGYSSVRLLCGTQYPRIAWWWGGRDSNPRREDYESPALT